MPRLPSQEGHHASADRESEAPTPGLVCDCADIGHDGRGGAADSAAADFFESKVRPVLAEHCYQCHSAQSKSLKGGLRLDITDGLRKGGDTGPAVVPGDLEASLLLKAITYDDDILKMPPKGKLPAAAIATLTQWVKQGADVPRDVEPTQSKKPPGLDFEAARSHWAYQPIRRPSIPTVHNRDWPRSPVDMFVLASLETAGLDPSPAADRRTLIRRAYYDLTGLPPTAPEIVAFENDKAPDAFARVIDRLLASPRYGQRWGRHWLDVARYADTKDGVLMFGDDRVAPLCLYLPRLRDSRVQRRPRLRPFHPRAARGRRGRHQRPALAARRHGFLDAGPRF